MEQAEEGFYPYEGKQRRYKHPIKTENNTVFKKVGLKTGINTMRFQE